MDSTKRRHQRHHKRQPGEQLFPIQVVKPHISPQNQKGKKHTYKILEIQAKPNELTGGQSATLIKNISNIYCYLFSNLNYKTKQEAEWTACYSGDDIARDHIQTLKNHDRSTILEWSVVEYFPED